MAMKIDFDMQPEVPVYRYFSEARFADDFIKGIIRVSTLSFCRRSEVIGQGDADEGFLQTSCKNVIVNEGNSYANNRLKQLGVVGEENKGTIVLNANIHQVMRDSFLLCTSFDFSPTLQEAFGNYCVQITHPDIFFRFIAMVLDKEHKLRYVKASKVIYRNIKTDFYEELPGEIGFVKKPDGYQEQNEFRFLWEPFELNGIEPFNLRVPNLLEGLLKRIV